MQGAGPQLQVIPLNWLEVVLLSLGVIAYAVGLLAVVFSASDAANSAGRPTFTTVTLQRPGKQAVVTLKLKADGVERDRVILVAVKAIKVESQGQSVVPIGPDRPIFTAFLRPNASGTIDHEIVTPFDPADATDLTIEAWSSADDAPSCTARRAIGSGCATVRIPPAPAVAKRPRLDEPIRPRGSGVKDRPYSSWSTERFALQVDVPGAPSDTVTA